MCRVSVLMPVYNAEKYLAEAINSIIEQTFTDWEFIIINDGSTDLSKDIILSYTDSRIKYYENSENLGLIRTLNKGIDLCKGEYIARMDSDDISLPRRIEAQVRLMNSNPNLALCGTNANIINGTSTATGKIVNPSDNITLQISLLFTNPFIHPSILIRKSKLNNERFDKNAIHVEDLELWTRIAHHGELANIKQPLMNYRWHNKNISVIHSSIQETAKDQIIKYQLIEELNLIPTDRELEIHRLTFKLYHLGTKNYITENKTNEVADWFKKLSDQNRKLKRYCQSDFDAFLWSRWIVLCVYQQRKQKIFQPNFVKINIPTLLKTIRLVIYLSKK